MTKNNGINNYSNVNLKALGNYTKGAVQNFEENIVNQTNYLEKVDNSLKNEKNTEDE